MGAGAAGLATAIFTARRIPGASIAALDGQSRLGAKILVSGGGRCNVTNRVVEERDFEGGPRTAIRRVLRAFPAAAAVAFFRELGVGLHEEEHGKLFPDGGRARTVLEALLREAGSRGVVLRRGCRVERIARQGDAFTLETSQGALEARRVVLATGGLSLPKTGSDGGGYRIARSLGHTLVETTPALVPLVLEGGFHAPLPGVSLEVELLIRPQGGAARRVRGSLLFTHFGISGPAALDASRHVLRCRIEGRACRVSARLVPRQDAAAIEGRLVALARARPRLRASGALATLLPASLADAVLRALGVSGDTALGQWPRAERRKVAAALDEWPLPVRESRGYAFAEVTAGGVPLREIEPGTMESRVCPGLQLVGEILDVDGRLGGFNFQWAWSSAFVAARALGTELSGQG